MQPELSATQIALLERLLSRGFRLVAFPLYASAIGVRRGGFAALIVPEMNGGLRLLGRPSYVIDGNLSVQIQKGSQHYFVWKQKQLEATPDRLAELEQFARELGDSLSGKL